MTEVLYEGWGKSREADLGGCGEALGIGLRKVGRQGFGCAVKLFPEVSVTECQDSQG